MLELRGAPALSPFRLAKLLEQLQSQVPQVSGVYAEFIHLADVDGFLILSFRPTGEIFMIPERSLTSVRDDTSNF